MNDLPDYNDDGTIFDDHGQTPPGSVVALHNNLIKALRKAYPAWKDTWLIRVDTRGGIVQVMNKAFSGDMGFCLHITEIDPEMKRVREMAGELFERYGIARDRGLSIKTAMQDMKVDPFGRPIYEK
ncbi:MAG: hypothetical protein GY815_04185 [Gammaproteobacteria bacterium]|nr:hypothetical protein [Gammaproteobacteria bacterium]